MGEQAVVDADWDEATGLFAMLGGKGMMLVYRVAADQGVGFVGSLPLDGAAVKVVVRGK